MCICLIGIYSINACMRHYNALYYRCRVKQSECARACFWRGAHTLQHRNVCHSKCARSNRIVVVAAAVIIVNIRTDVLLQYICTNMLARLLSTIVRVCIRRAHALSCNVARGVHVQGQSAHARAHFPNALPLNTSKHATHTHMHICI